jgi:adenosine deaminase
VTLHAGELTMGVVEPSELRFHIRQAVEIAHAKRIGHGVDLMYEQDPEALLALMAKNKIAVEINLSSNDQILNVSGKAHPFPIYRERGVPVVLSTDDEGIERIDRTHELQRAVETYDLSYADLIGMERNTLEYAFVPGASLWSDARAWQLVSACGVKTASDPPTADCGNFLAGSEKARLQWALEVDLARFEKELGQSH